jgi:hypothetical protein
VEKLLYLGRLDVLGERGLLAVPATDLVRLRYNPFYSYLEVRVDAFLDGASVAGAGPALPR